LKKLSDKKEEIILRRGQVTLLYSKGLSENEMARELNVCRVTINSDLRVMRNQALTKTRTFTEKELPHEIDSLMVSNKLLTKKAWAILDNEESSEKMIATAMFTILKCNEQKRTFLMDKCEIQTKMKLMQSSAEEAASSLADRQMQEAMEAERYRQERIF
jgi:hypothetical protein